MSEEVIRHCSKCLAIYRSEFTRCPVDGAHIVDSLVDPMLGVTVAEHYQIDEPIGVGSSGRVYLAHHSRLAQRRFALKILFGDLAATASARMRFSHEAESASRLAHPNLVSVVDFGRTPAGLLYLAMDFIEGPTLGSVIAREGPLPQDRAVRIGLQLCRGLAHAHDLGLIHRDFKPDNILVSKDAHGDVPRVVDFGIALSADLDGDPRLTATGITLGTPAYAAPEQTADGEIDHRADLFALGVTMYEMLTGKLPFDGSMVEMMRRNATGDAPPMNERNPNVQVTPALQYVVSKLMARDPNDRYQSAREALEALSELPRRPGGATRGGATSLGMDAATAPPGALGSGNTPAGMPVRARPSSPALGTRPSSPVLGARPSSPVLGTRPSSLSIGARPSSPALGARPSSPALGTRPSSLSIGARPSTLSMSVPSPSSRPSSTGIPLVLPSSSTPRPAKAPVESVDSRPVRIELAPLVTPVEPRRWSGATLGLAVVLAAVISAAVVLGYQRITAASSRGAPSEAVAPDPSPGAAPAGTSGEATGALGISAPSLEETTPVAPAPEESAEGVPAATPDGNAVRPASDTTRPRSGTRAAKAAQRSRAAQRRAAK
ncbi:MAG: protein kinase [Kofleriaceae bacterium]